MNKEKGYTLTEIIATITILAVLAGVAIPRFTGQTEKANVAEAIHIVGIIKTAEFQYFDAHSTWATMTWVCYPSSPVSTGARTELGIDISNACGPQSKWTYFVDQAGKNAPLFSIRAIRNDTGPQGANFIEYDLEGPNRGQWDGQGDFAPGGKYWSNLQN